MATRNGDTNTASVSGSASFSFRTAAIVAVVTVLANMLTVHRKDEQILEMLTRIDTRVSWLEGAVGKGAPARRASDSTGGAYNIGSDE